jgi:glycosyltransferase involved in cell wall biosynthesis
VVAKVLRGGLLGDIAKLQATRLGRLRLRIITQRVDAFAVISQEIDEELSALGVDPPRRRFVPNGVDVDRYSPIAPEEKRALRMSMIGGMGPVALFAGRLEPEKQIEKVVDFWPSIRRLVPGATLIVAGEGSLHHSIQTAAREGVLLVGPQVDMAPWYKISDFFILPSSSEGLSNALLEAMSSAVVPIATAVGGAQELIRHRKNGFLLPSSNPTEMADAIAQALAFQDSQEAALEARRTVVDHYSLEKTVASLEKLYREISVPRQKST